MNSPGENPDESKDEDKPTGKVPDFISDTSEEARKPRRKTTLLMSMEERRAERLRRTSSKVPPWLETLGCLALIPLGCAAFWLLKVIAAIIISPITYFVLRTFFDAPSGLAGWVIAVFASYAIIGILGKILGEISTHAEAAEAKKAEKESSSKDAKDQDKEAERTPEPEEGPWAKILRLYAVEGPLGCLGTWFVRLLLVVSVWPVTYLVMRFFFGFRPIADTWELAALFSFCLVVMSIPIMDAIKDDKKQQAQRKRRAEWEAEIAAKKKAKKEAEEAAAKADKEESEEPSESTDPPETGKIES